MPILPALCEENPPVTSGSPNKGPLMLKVYYFDRNYAESHSWGTRHLSDGIFYHYSDVIMSTMASEITSFTMVYSTVYSGAGEREHQSSASLAFVRGLHWWPVNSPHKGPVTRKIFPFDDVIMWRICITGLEGIHSYLLAVSQLTHNVISATSYQKLKVALHSQCLGWATPALGPEMNLLAYVIMVVADLLMPGHQQ